MTAKERTPGFTLIELVIVLALIGILVGMGIPQFKNAIKRSKEAALRENLHIMRIVINQYYTDKKKYPMSLQALVDEQYLHSIPKDPITESSETWIEVMEELNEDDLLSGVIPGIADVRSGAEGNGLDGTPYESW
jgi:general secretion pathway protein G